MYDDMLNIEQMKHVITYYYLELLPDHERSTPVYIQRDCVYLNKTRGEICSDLYSNTKYHSILKKLHNAKDVHQINSVPINSLCSIEHKKIPKESAGVQFIIYGTPVEHVCVQKRYQQICYYYFKLRNFPTFTQREILRWLHKQPWYIPKLCEVNFILKRLLDSNIPEKIHREFLEMVSLLSV